MQRLCQLGPASFDNTCGALPSPRTCCTDDILLMLMAAPYLGASMGCFFGSFMSNLSC
jgi:hypothetical protein